MRFVNTQKTCRSARRQARGATGSIDPDPPQNSKGFASASHCLLRRLHPDPDPFNCNQFAGQGLGGAGGFGAFRMFWRVLALERILSLYINAIG